jgi:uncharacterized BrkB/YihY/UPF0761 family membrane protein
MDLAKSWLVALAVYLAGSMVTAFAAVTSESPPEEFAGIAWSAVPSLATYLAMAALSALVHSAPERSRTSRHALAVLAVPAVLILGSLVFGLVQRSSPAGIAAGAVGALAGTAAGSWAAGLVRGRRPPTSDDGYF